MNKPIWTLERLQKWVFGSNEETAKIEEEVEEETDCPVHGKLGGINECPRC